MSRSPLDLPLSHYSLDTEPEERAARHEATPSMVTREWTVYSVMNGFCKSVQFCLVSVIVSQLCIIYSLSMEQNTHEYNALLYE